MTDGVVALEVAEMTASVDLYRSAGREVVEHGGIVVENLEDGAVLAATQLDVLALNRAIGVGLHGRPSDAALGRAVGAFRAIGSPRFFFQVAPVEGTRDLGERLEALGLRHYNNWMRLTRELTDLPSPPASSVTTESIGPEHAGTFSGIVAAAFGYPPAISPITASVVGRHRWTHYLAYEGGEAIGTAAMFVAGEAAWFGFAATAAERRGKGAQTALIIRRLHDAAAAGCRWVSVEAAEQTPEREAPSLRNLTRLGFTVAYRRPNYIWTRDALTG
jgi:GNAT superfamily N-acetyltransferase